MKILAFFRRLRKIRLIKRIEKALGFKLYPDVVDYVFYDRYIRFTERCCGLTTACALKFILDFHNDQSNIISPELLIKGCFSQYRDWNDKHLIVCTIGDCSSYMRAQYTTDYYRRIYEQLKKAHIKVRPIKFYKR
ncbi:MAG: hypothetical protein J6C96_12605 [Oscillospiraceae bacterium]|nr:hypothetical protein [Oscillospiraceae bacterium]